MGELINGRTPEEIKAGLRCETAGEHCSTCTYQCECLSEDGDLGVLNREALALVERLESERDAALAKAPRWISVEERLPEKAGKYIVCTKKMAVYCTAFRFFHGKGYFASDSTVHVTHWMPLPEPPKGETT